MHARQPEAAGHSLAAAIKTILAIPAPAPGLKGEKGDRGLRAESKAAWTYLVLSAGGWNRSWTTHAANVGAAIGTSPRSGIRALQSLARFGLIEIPDHYKGEFSIFIRDPQEATKAWHSRTASDNGQGELDFAPADNSPSEVAADAKGPATVPLVPALARRSASAASADLVQDPAADLVQDPPNPHRSVDPARAQSTSNIKHQSLWENGGSCTRSAAPLARSAEIAPAAKPPAKPDPTRLSAADYAAAVRLYEATLSAPAPSASAGLNSIAGDLAGVLHRVDPPPDRRVERAHAWADQIARRINDPNLAKNRDGTPSRGGQLKLLRLAWAVADGELTRTKLDAAFNALEWHCRHKQIASRAAFFFGIIGRVFAQVGIDWEKQPNQGAVTP